MFFFLPIFIDFPFFLSKLFFFLFKKSLIEEYSYASISLSSSLKKNEHVFPPKKRKENP